MTSFLHPAKFRKYAVALCLLGMAAVVFYFFADKDIAAFFRDGRHILRQNHWLLGVKQFGRVLVPFWLIMIIAWVRRRPKLIVASIVAILLTAFVVNATKLAVQRPRPFAPPHRLVSSLGDGRSLNYSFPSGDTATAFALAAVAASAVALRPRIFLYFLASLVGALRVAMSYHYPSDVLAGAIVGLICARAAFGITPYLCKRAPPSWRWKRRPRWLFTGILLLPMAIIASELAAKQHHFRTFISSLGPLVIVVLLATRGRVWLRWLANRRLGKTLRPTRHATADAILLVAGALLVILPCLGWVSLYDRDEGYYVGCAAEMLDRNDPFVPHFSGEPWMEKPPLGYWAMAASMATLGRNEFAARLPTALAGVLALWLLFRLASRMDSPRIGGIAAVILGTTVLFGGASRLAILDTFLVSSVLLSMTGFWSFLNGEERRGLWLFYLGCGLGGLTKGPLGVCLPVIAVGGYVIWTGSWALLRRMRPLQGTLIVLVVVGIWALPANWITDGQFLYELVWIRTLRPVFVPLQGHGGGNMWEYLLLIPMYIPVLFFGFLPWTPLLIMGWKNIRKGESWRSKRMAFLLSWIVAQLAVFSLVRTKLPHHILPLMPPLAVLAALALARLADMRYPPIEEACQRWGRKLLVCCLSVGAAAIIAVPFVTGFWTDWPWFIPASLALATGAWAANNALKRQQFDRAFVGLAAATCLCFALTYQVALPRLEKGKSAWRVAHYLKTHYTRDERATMRIGRKSYREVSVVFYLERPVDNVSDLRTYLASASSTVVIIPETKLEQVIATEGNLPYHLLWKERVWIPEKNRWLNLLMISNENDRPETAINHVAESPPHDHG